MKTKARLPGMQAYSWRQYKVGLCMSDMLLKAVFWDLDGTLIDSEPYWHEGEMEIAAAHGGYWDEDLAWSCSGTPLDHCAKTMIEHGTNLPPEQIAKAMVDYVAKKEFERVPWTNGVLDVLGSLVDAGIPSVLVTTSPRRLAQNVIDHAPAGAFAGFVCGDDDLPHKPDPAPYLAAAKMLGIETGVAGADGAAALLASRGASLWRTRPRASPRLSRPEPRPLPSSASTATPKPTVRNAPPSTASPASPPKR